MHMLSDTFYLAISQSKRYGKLNARLTQKQPALRAGEIAMELTVQVPKALFKRPTLRAEIEIPGDIPEPVITAEVKDGIAATLSEQLGLPVRITVEGPHAS